MSNRGMGRLVLAALAASAARMPKLGLGWLASLAASCAVAGAAEAPSRAAAGLLHDGVQPIADLVNTAEPGKPPAFRDGVGSFQVEAEGRALLVRGSFPKENVWYFDRQEIWRVRVPLPGGLLRPGGTLDLAALPGWQNPTSGQLGAPFHLRADDRDWQSGWRLSATLRRVSRDVPTHEALQRLEPLIRSEEVVRVQAK